MTLYVAINEEKLGPYSLAEAQNLVALGSLRATDLAWYEGLTDWIPLNQVPGFARTRRPLLVWIISLYYFVFTPIGLLIMAMIPYLLSGSVHITDAQRTYFESQTYFDYAIAGVTLLINLVGAILLFQLRRPALYCFGTTFVIAIFNYTYQIVYKNWLNSIGGSVGIGGVIGVGITIAMILYIWHLFKKGVLR